MSKSKKKPSKDECIPGCGAEFNRLSSTVSSDTSFKGQSQITFNVSILPIISSRPEKYKPMPYTFRVPLSSFYSPIKNGIVKCPPFYLQLDHAIAVIWSLFTKCDVSKEIGIVQLQWALSFLRNVHNNHGEHTKDVEICMKAMEDQLINLYADLVDEVKKIPPRKKCCSLSCKKSSSAGSLPTNEDVTLKQNYVKKHIPFSVNYADILKRNGGGTSHVKKICSAPKSANSNLSCQSGKSSKSNTAVQDNAQMIVFLNSWRSEQVGKIEAELKRLHSIENFIANANNNNFTPYLDGNSLNVLATRKNCATNTNCPCSNPKQEKKCKSSKSTEPQ